MGAEGTRGEPFRPSHLFFLWFYVLICLTLGGCMTHLYIHRATFVYMRSFPLTCVRQGIIARGLRRTKSNQIRTSKQAVKRSKVGFTCKDATTSIYAIFFLPVSIPGCSPRGCQHVNSRTTFHCTHTRVGTSSPKKKKKFGSSGHFLVTNPKVPRVPKRGSTVRMTLRSMREAPPPLLLFHLVHPSTLHYCVIVFCFFCTSGRLPTYTW
ncbi:hypothetical protein BGY98DRAFT_690360 [Russula aff. rugulosa BPL654]|nr:hypothetical protein BGY98DRAFT_690360 [Russula aff. rugulosa BPL654]